MRESGFYTVNGKRRHMTAFKADRMRAAGKSVEGPLEDKSYKGPAEDKASVEAPVEDSRTLGELRKEAKAAGISGYSKLNKERLLEVLNG